MIPSSSTWPEDRVPNPDGLCSQPYGVTSQSSRTLPDAQFRSKLADAILLERARELDRREDELERKVRAYDAEFRALLRMREELNRDFDQLGKEHAQLDREAENLRKLHDQLLHEGERTVESPPREIMPSFASFVRKLMKPSL